MTYSNPISAGIVRGVAAAFMPAPAGAVAAPSCLVPPALWDRPRSGAAIPSSEPLPLDVRRVP